MGEGGWNGTGRGGGVKDRRSVVVVVVAVVVGLQLRKSAVVMCVVMVRLLYASFDYLSTTVP